MKKTTGTKRALKRQPGLFDTESLVQMFVRTKAQISGLYDQHDQLLSEILRRRKGRSAIKPGSTFTVDGETYVLVDNFAETNKVYRAHGIQRYEIRVMTKKEKEAGVATSNGT